MAQVELIDLQKVYPGGVHAVRDATFDVADREFVVLVGPSGCGKSTLLRLIAGLESVTSGEIRIGGRRVNELEPRDRDIAMVFQSYALYPHLNVFDNMALGLKLRRVPKPEIRNRVLEAARVLDIEGLLERRPRQLSGGQRQRVAVGRAIVRKPQVFLFDEPLSNLDAKKRVQTRADILQLHRNLKATILYVTHDQVEAMTMGDRIVVMRDGVIQQIGSPMEVYERPANRFVAEFIGNPPMNVLRVRRAGDGLWAPGDVRLELPVEPKLPAAPEFDLGIRPEHVQLGEAPGGRDCARLQGRIDFVERLGNEQLVHVKVGESTIVASVRGTTAGEVGERTSLALDLERCRHFDIGTGAPLAVRQES